jgi:hypothetical protein
MQKLLLFTLYCAITALLLPMNATAQSFAHAGEYITFISGQHREITKDMLSYTTGKVPARLRIDARKCSKL